MSPRPYLIGSFNVETLPAPTPRDGCASCLVIFTEALKQGEFKLEVQVIEYSYKGYAVTHRTFVQQQDAIINNCYNILFSLTAFKKAFDYKDIRFDRLNWPNLTRCDPERRRKQDFSNKLKVKHINSKLALSSTKPLF